MHTPQLRHALTGLAVAILLGAVAVLGSHRTSVAAKGDFAGLVDIGGGRKVYMECRGSGYPMIVLISGKGNGAADWNEILVPRSVRA